MCEGNFVQGLITSFFLFFQQETLKYICKSKITEHKFKLVGKSKKKLIYIEFIVKMRNIGIFVLYGGWFKWGFLLIFSK